MNVGAAVRMEGGAEQVYLESYHALLRFRILPCEPAALRSGYSYAVREAFWPTRGWGGKM